MRTKTTRDPFRSRARLRKAETNSVIGRFWKRRVGWMLVRNTIVSTGVFLLGLGLLWALVEQAGLDATLATAIGFIVSNSIHYVFGRTWIFRGADRAVTVGYALFLSNALVGLAITVSLFWVLITFTPIHYLAARVIVSIFAGLAMFALNATITFRQV